MTQNYHPLITSLAFNNENVFVPFRYNFTIDQIAQIKKYLPKNLLKLHGIDAQGSSQTTPTEQQALQKSKLKIKSVKGISTETQKPIEFLPKQQVTVLEWYNKSIDLQIPYLSKCSQAMLEQQISLYLSYYLENYMIFKNTLNQELYTDLAEKPVKLTTDQIANETDIIFACWNIDPQPTDDKVKVIRTNVPILLCLNKNESYDLFKLKELIKTDILSSLSIMLKHGFNTRVITLGTGEKEFICLNSYTQEQNATQEEEKLKAIIGQQKVVHVETEQTKIAAKKDHLFLFIVLAILVVIYFGLKLFPIHGRNEHQYIKPTPISEQQPSIVNQTLSEQQIF